MKPYGDEQILNNVPDHLIRPLLALCMRVHSPNTMDTYKQLLRDIEGLREACTDLESQLFCHHLGAVVHLRMQAMQDAQKWARKNGHAAEALGVYIHRWIVEMLIDGENKFCLVSYVDDGVDRRRMERKVRPFVVEVTEDDLPSMMDG